MKQIDNIRQEFAEDLCALCAQWFKMVNERMWVREHKLLYIFAASQKQKIE